MLSYALGDWTFDVVCDLVGPVFKVNIQALLGNIELSVWEPAIEVEVFNSEGGLGKLVPLHPFSSLPPVPNRVVNCPLERLLVRYGSRKYPCQLSD